MKEFLKAKQLLEGSLNNPQPEKQVKQPSVDYFNKSAAKPSRKVLQPSPSNPLSTIAQLSKKSAASKESITVATQVEAAARESVKSPKVSVKPVAGFASQISSPAAKPVTAKQQYQQTPMTTGLATKESDVQIQQPIASQSSVVGNVEQAPVNQKQRIRLSLKTLEVNKVNQSVESAEADSVIEPEIAAEVTENNFGGFAATSNAAARKSHIRKPKAKFQLFDKTANGKRSKAKSAVSVGQAMVKRTSVAPDVTEFDTTVKSEVSEKNNASNRASSSKSNVKPYVFDSSKKRGVKSRQRTAQIKQNKPANAKFDSTVIFKKLSGVSKKAFTPIVSASSAAHSTVVGSVKNQYQKQSQSILDRFVAKVEASKTSAIHKIRANFDLSQPFSGKFDKSNLEPDQAFISEHNFKSIVQLSSFAILVMLCLSFTVNLWLNSEHGFGFRSQMIQDLALIHTEIDEIVVANTQLEKEILNYREDKQAVESMVRYELGMIKPNETFVRIIR